MLRNALVRFDNTLPSYLLILSIACNAFPLGNRLRWTPPDCAWRVCASKQRRAHTAPAWRDSRSALPSYPEKMPRIYRTSRITKRGPFEFATDRPVPRQPFGIVRWRARGISANFSISLWNAGSAPISTVIRPRRRSNCC